MIRVLVVDDQELVRAGFRMILSARPEIEVVGESSDGREAVAAVDELKPDVVLMDIRMPNMDGIEATRRILERRPDTRILILTTYDLDEYVYDSMRAGASGFLLKSAPPDELAHGIHTVASGDALLAPPITRRLIERFVSKPLPGTMPEKLTSLTARELEVLKLIARGMSNAEIAAELVVSDATVKTHVARILMKVDLRDRVQAVVLAYESGLVAPGDEGD